MSTIEFVKSDQLVEGNRSPGITRRIAFKGDDYVLLNSKSDPGVVSGWHHHGDYDVYGYLASGSGRLEIQADPSQAVSLQPGDFFHVPPNTIHREINPSQDKENEYILFLRGTGPTVVNIGE